MIAGIDGDGDLMLKAETDFENEWLEKYGDRTLKTEFITWKCTDYPLRLKVSIKPFKHNHDTE